MSWLLDIALLREERDFRYLYIGQFVSFIGVMMTSVVLPVYVYSLTKSTLMVGLVGIFQLIPLLFTALLGGVLADRFPRRKLILMTECALGFLCLMLFVHAYCAVQSVFFIYMIAMGSSAVVGLHRPAIDSLSQQLVPPHAYKQMGALGSFKFSFCMIAGPALAGLIIAWFSIPIAFLVDALTYIVSIWALLCMHHVPLPEHKNEEPKSVLSSLKDGLNIAFSSRPLMGSYLVDILAMVFAMPIALFPAMADELYGTGSLGLLYAAPAVGALLVSFVSGWTQHVKRDGMAISLSAIGWGLAMVGFGLAHSLSLALFFLAVSGGMDAISGIFRSAMWNHLIPMSHRGRLAGIEMISYMSGPKLGDFRAGAMASGFGIPFTIVSGGILCVLSVALCSWCLPEYWRYKEQPNPEESLANIGANETSAS